MAAERLTFSVGPASGSAPTQQVTAFSGFSIKATLASGPEVSFSMPGQSPAALLTDGLATDVWVYRNGTLWLRCRTLPVDQEWGDSGEDQATVTAVGYRRLVEARFVIALGALPAGVPVFTAVDQGTIIWNLIQHTQAQTGGDLGITSGVVATGVTRTRGDYLIGDSIGKLTNDLGDVLNGCWWGIDASKVLTAKLWSAFAARTDPIALGVNARKLRRTRGRGFANVGGASGDKLLTVPSFSVDAGVATDPRGRWEAFDSSHSDVKVQATVTEYSAGLLAERLHPPSQWTIDLDPAAYFEGGSMYAEGEFVKIVVPASAVDEIGGPAANVNAQITEVSIGEDDNGEIAVALAAMEVT